MKFFFATVITIFFVADAFAQESVEVTITYQLESEEESSFYYSCPSLEGEDEVCYTQQLKNDITQTARIGTTPLWRSLEMPIRRGEITVYDAKTKQKIPRRSTGESPISINNHGISPHLITHEKILAVTISILPVLNYNIQQKWSIDGSNLTSETTWIEPIAKIKDHEEPLFSIPMNNHKDIYELNNKEVTWAKLTRIRRKIEEIGFSVETIRELIWERPRRGETPTFYSNGEEPFSQHILPKDYVERLQSTSYDTVTTFHPETYQEEISVYENDGITFDSIIALDIYQLWYYSDSSKILQNRIVGVIPLANRKYHPSHNVWRLEPLYLIKFGEDKY